VWYNSVRYTAPFTTAVIPDGASATMTLEVQVASPNPGGDYETIVRTAATADPLRLDSIKAVLRLRAPKVDMIIATSGDDVYDLTFSGLGGVSSNAGERGVTVNFPLIVQNESSLADSFTIDWVAPGGGWSAVIEIDGADVYGPVGTGLGGTSLQTVNPGETAVFMVTIENVEGNDSFEVSWTTPSGWTVTFDGQASPVSGIVAGTYEWCRRRWWTD
jgi:hypothetical protein